MEGKFGEETIRATAVARRKKGIEWLKLLVGCAREMQGERRLELGETAGVKLFSAHLLSTQIG